VVKENIQYNSLALKTSDELKVLEQEVRKNKLFEDYYSAIDTIKLFEEKEKIVEKTRRRIEELKYTEKFLLENGSFKHDINRQKVKESEALVKIINSIIQEKKSYAASFISYFKLCNQILLEIDKFGITRAVNMFSDDIRSIHDKVNKCFTQSLSLTSRLKSMSDSYSNDEKNNIEKLIYQINKLYFEISSRTEFIFNKKHSRKCSEKVESKNKCEEQNNTKIFKESLTKEENSSKYLKKTPTFKRNNTTQCNADSKKEDNNYLCLNLNKEIKDNNYLSVNINREKGNKHNKKSGMKKLVVKDINDN